MNERPYTEGLQSILQLNPVVYNYNGLLNTPTDREIVGIIAQELQIVAPYMVEKVKVRLEPENIKRSESMEVLTVNTSSIQYMTINAIKELNDKISSQEEIIQSMQIMLEGLQKEILQLKM